LLARCAAKDKASAVAVDASVSDVAEADVNAPEVGEDDAAQDVAPQPDAGMQQEADAPYQQEAEAGAVDSPSEASLPEGGGPCDSSAACSAPYVCMYPTAEMCAATTGLCLQPDVGCKQGIGCACSGQTVMGCGPIGGGYFPWPIQYAGPCIGS
jgi:hypothetical protein